MDRVMKMDRKKFSDILICLIGLFILGQIIFNSVYWRIWVPYFKEEFKEADSKCVVKEYKNIGVNNVDQYYGIYRVEFELEGKTQKGFFWDTSWQWKNALTSASLTNFGYPYEYTECTATDPCRGMETLPTWYCDSTGELNDALGIAQKYYGGDTFDCYWTLHKNSNIDIDPEDLPFNFGLNWPTVDTQYFVIITESEPYYSVHEYNALWAIPLGLMTWVPAIILVFFGIAYCKDRKYWKCRPRIQIVKIRNESLDDNYR